MGLAILKGYVDCTSWYKILVSIFIGTLSNLMQSCIIFKLSSRVVVIGTALIGFLSSKLALGDFEFFETRIFYKLNSKA